MIRVGHLYGKTFGKFVHNFLKVIGCISKTELSVKEYANIKT